jgi:hypothetical protein
VTCIRPPLLCTQRLEGHLLQAPNSRFQEPQVHERLATVVVAGRLLDAGAANREDRDAAPVRPAHRDRAQLTTAHEPEGSEEEVVGL